MNVICGVCTRRAGTHTTQFSCVGKIRARSAFNPTWLNTDRTRMCAAHRRSHMTMACAQEESLASVYKYAQHFFLRKETHTKHTFKDSNFDGIDWVLLGILHETIVIKPRFQLHTQPSSKRATNRWAICSIVVLLFGSLGNCTTRVSCL